MVRVQEGVTEVDCAQALIRGQLPPLRCTRVAVPVVMQAQREKKVIL